MLRTVAKKIEASALGGTNGRIVFGLIAAIYFAATLISGPRTPEEMSGISHLSLGPFVVSRPLVLSGDSPHYLVSVYSLILDHDFDLRNNYDSALSGGWEMGARFRGKPIDRHVDVDSKAREIGTHSPFFPMLLALLVFPLGNSPWIASACIWLTTLAGLTGIWLFGTWVKETVRELPDSRLVLALSLLALGTPLLCYSRDIWTEPWVLAIWMGILLSNRTWLTCLLVFVGVLIKYPFFVVPLTLGLLALVRRRYGESFWVLASAMSGLVVAFLFTQWLFQDVDHFSLFHSGIHAGFDLPFDGALGMLLSPKNGLLVFFPFLIWGISAFKSKWRRSLPVLAFFLVHASYSDWAGGTGFSARYLVPLLPFAVAKVIENRPRGWFFWMLSSISLFWGLFGGFFAGVVYDRSPWGVVIHIWENIFP